MMDASDRKSIRAAEKAAKLSDRNRGEVLIALAGTTQGRRWLWDRLEAAHIFGSVYSDSPTRMAFLEGERNQGLLLLADILHWCPDQFLQMIREFNARRTESAALPDRDPGERSVSEEPGRVDQGHPIDTEAGGIDSRIAEFETLYRD